MRGRALKEEGLYEAGRIQDKIGARLFCDTFAPRLQRGKGRVKIERIPYFSEQIEEFLEGVDLLILVGAKPPVSFFAYPGRKSQMTPEGCRVEILAHLSENGTDALTLLADALRAPKTIKITEGTPPPLPSDETLTPLLVAQTLGALLPEGAILCDESATSGAPLLPLTESAPPHDHLALTGGAIGQGLPLAVGAALAAPDRQIVCLHGDGGALYTVQSLWTMARESLKRDHHHLFQPILRDPQYRTHARRRGECGTQSALHAGSLQP